MLTELGEGLYIADGKLRFIGFMLGTRMAVVRLDGDGLLLYSPLFLTSERAAGNSIASSSATAPS